MLTLRKAGERGQTSTSWLQSHHSFSFGDYRDPDHVRFGPLRVLNEDVVAAGGGFPPHPHRDMEIVTYVLSGALAHKDSLGSGSTIRVGEVQRMSAGTGIMHSEYNASESAPVHLLQIWILPIHHGAPPGYEQKRFNPAKAENALLPIVAPRKSTSPENAVTVDQDVTVYTGRFQAGRSVHHELAAGRRAWLQLAKGAVTMNGVEVAEGDGVAVNDESGIDIVAGAPSEVLLFDLPGIPF